MTQIGNVSEILAIKRQLDILKRRGLVEGWEVPYENILTRLTAAIFFLTPVEQSHLDEIWKSLGKKNKDLRYRLNEEKALSDLEWRVEFKKK